MNNLEILKQELISQKNIIEKKGGTVVVANSNPSPAEITAGLKSMAPRDLSDANATEEDVLEGKTFYAGNGELKTGTMKDSGGSMRHLFEFEENTQSSEDEIIYNVSADIKNLRSYIFRYNANNVVVNFHSDIESIGEYAFDSTPNFKFNNIAEMVNLKTIEDYAFNKSNAQGFDLSALPSSVETIGPRAFQDMLSENGTVNIPTSLTTFGSGCFACSKIVHASKFNMSKDTKISILNANGLQCCVFDCDFVVPTTVTTMGAKFLFDGSFNNMIISENVATIGANCFNATSTTALSDVRYKTVTFTRQTPPSISVTAFSSQAVQNGLKIYVPDESYDAYLSKLSNFSSCVFPVSQKE